MTNLKKYLNISSALIVMSTISATNIEAAASSSSGPDATMTASGIRKIKDTGPDSCSKIFHHTRKEGGSVRRLLALDGGGVRGTIEAAELAVLEELLNLRREPSTPWIRIADVFDAAAGTSTGSILAAGLFTPTTHYHPGQNGYSAMDLLKIYARHGDKIFDDNKRTIGGARGAKYGAEGLEELLRLYFGDTNIASFEKPLYVIATDSNSSKPVIYQKKTHTPVTTALRASAAAPVFLPGVETTRGNEKTVLVDGGLVANNPAQELYNQENNDTDLFEIYSFGTGLEMKARNTETDRGVSAVGVVIGSLFGNQTSTTERALREETKRLRNGLRYYARLNPILEEGRAGLDDTSANYVKYCMDKAFAVTQGGAFKDMLRQLGLDVTDYDIEFARGTVCRKLSGLTSFEFDKLTPLEKELVERKALDLDFSFYKHLNVNGVEFSREQTDTFLGQFLTHYGKEAKKYWSITGEKKEEKIIRYVTNGTQAHQLILGMEESGTILSPLSRQDISVINETLATRICADFAKVYEAGNKLDNNILADVYIKDIFREIEGSLSSTQIDQLIEVVDKYITDTRVGKSVTGWKIASVFRPGITRAINPLLEALHRYKAKYIHVHTLADVYQAQPEPIYMESSFAASSS